MLFQLLLLISSMYGSSNIFSRNQQQNSSNNSYSNNRLGNSYSNNSQSHTLGTYRVQYKDGEKPSALMTSINTNWREFPPISITTKDKTLHLSSTQLRIQDYYLIRIKKLNQANKRHFETAHRNGYFNQQLLKNDPPKLLPYSSERPLDLDAIKNSTNRNNSPLGNRNAFNSDSNVNSSQNSYGNSSGGYLNASRYNNSNNNTSNNIFSRNSQGDSNNSNNNNSDQYNRNNNNASQGNIFSSNRNSNNAFNSRTGIGNSGNSGNIFGNQGSSSNSNSNTNNIFNNQAKNNAFSQNNNTNNSNGSNSNGNNIFNNNNNSSGYNNNISNNNSSSNNIINRNQTIPNNNQNNSNTFNNQNNNKQNNQSFFPQNNNNSSNIFNNNNSGSSQNNNQFNNNQQLNSNIGNLNNSSMFNANPYQLLKQQAIIFNGIIKQIEQRVVQRINPTEKTTRNITINPYQSSRSSFNQNDSYRDPYFNLSYSKKRKQTDQTIEILISPRDSNHKEQFYPAKGYVAGSLLKNNHSLLPLQSKIQNLSAYQRNDGKFSEINLTKKCESVLIKDFNCESRCWCSVRFDIRWLDRIFQGKETIISKQHIELPSLEVNNLASLQLLISVLKESFPIIRSDAKIILSPKSSIVASQEVTLVGTIEQRAINLDPRNYEIFYTDIKNGQIHNFTVTKKQNGIKTATVSWDNPIKYRHLDFAVPNVFNLELSQVVCCLPQLNSRCRITFSQLPPKIKQTFKSSGKQQAMTSLNSFIQRKNNVDKLFKLCSIYNDGSWTLIVQKFN